MVQAQLLLIPTDTAWRLDPTTRRIGRQGLAQARAALAAAASSAQPVAEPVDASMAPIESPIAA